jgi:hypothetical protein
LAQALRDDNSSLVGNFADEVGRRQYFGHKPDPLARQQAHLLDLAAGVPVRRDADETPDRHLPAGDPRLSDDRLVGALLLAPFLAPEPFLDEGGAQRADTGFLPQLSITGLLKRLSIEAAAHTAGAMCSRGPLGGVISDNSREMRPKYRKARPYLIAERAL